MKFSTGKMAKLVSGAVVAEVKLFWRQNLIFSVVVFVLSVKQTIPRAITANSVFHAVPIPANPQSTKIWRCLENFAL